MAAIFNLIMFLQFSFELWYFTELGSVVTKAVYPEAEAEA